jgi:EthD domain
MAEAAGWTVSPYDGHVEFWVRSMDVLQKALADPEYPAKIDPEEDKFFDRTRTMVTIGWEEVIIENGSIN